MKPNAPPSIPELHTTTQFEKNFQEFITTQSEGGKKLGKKGLAKVSAANNGLLLVPAYDLTCFIAREILAADKETYTLHHRISVGDVTIVDKKYIPKSIEAMLVPQTRYDSRFFDEDEYDYSPKVAQRFKTAVNGRIEELCKHNTIVKTKAIGVLPCKEPSEYCAGYDKYPYSLAMAQLKNKETKEKALEQLNITTTHIFISEIARPVHDGELGGSRCVDTRREFLALHPKDIALRWYGDCAVTYDFDAFGVRWP